MFSHVNGDSSSVSVAWVVSPWGSFSLFVLYRAKAEAKSLQCALSTTEEGVVDESTLLTWGYGTEQR